MAYNQKTAIENQKQFLKSQMKSGYPAIEKRARETLKAIEEHERQQKLLDKRVKAFNKAWDKEHKKSSKR